MSSSCPSSFALSEKIVTSRDGTKIFAQATGDSHRRTIAFVHGFALSALVWNDIMRDERLLEAFHLVAYDIRGHGRSGKPGTSEEYSSLRYAQDFDAVMKAFDVSSPPILVGWSLGAAVSADVTAHLGPESLAGIVYTAALPWLLAGAEVSTAWSASQGPGFMSTDNASLAVSTRMEFATKLFSEPEKVPVDVLWSWFGSTFLLDPSKLMFQLGRAQDTTNLFKAGANGLPVLIINGDPSKDSHTNVVEAARVIREQFKNTREYRMEDASHACFYEGKDEYVRELLVFAMGVFEASPVEREY